MSIQALFVTHSFPPYAFPESFVAAKRMGNIPGVSVDVVTMHAFLPWVRWDTSLDDYVNKRFRKITKISPPSWYSKLPFHRLESFFSFPDSYHWLKFLYLREIGDLSKSDYNILVTSSMYHSAHLIGLDIKNRYPHLPWIAHFSDPWTQSPYRNKNKVIGSVNKYHENNVFKKADIIIFTCHETAELTLKNAEAIDPKKIIVIPHCFDEALYKSKRKHFDFIKNRFVIRYVGNFYADRTPDYLLEAIRIMLKNNPHLVSEVLFEFVGSSEKVIKITCPILSHVVKIIPSVCYKDSLSLMSESDLLLVIDAPAKMNIFFPSKLIDYIGSKRPIFGITSPGTTRRIIEEYGGLCVSFDDSPQEIATALLGAIEFHRKNPYRVNEHAWGQYTAEAIGKRIKGVMEDLLSKSHALQKNVG
jgi:glycosyltransferase involved in cell wall biosynthesis